LNNSQPQRTTNAVWVKALTSLVLVTLPWTKLQSAILAVQKIANRLPPSVIHFTVISGFVGILNYGINWFGSAALWAAVGETGFVRL
jgi:hypothetical protein